MVNQVCMNDGWKMNDEWMFNQGWMDDGLMMEKRLMDYGCKIDGLWCMVNE
jgi:hypothetical protein